VHLAPEFTFSEVKEGYGIGMTIFLIEANSGILKGMRVVALPTKFSIMFQKAANEQKEKPFSVFLYEQGINKIYANYTAPQMAKTVDTYRIKG
jgi:hypothetical protein